MKTEAILKMVALNVVAGLIAWYIMREIPSRYGGIGSDAR